MLVVLDVDVGVVVAGVVADSMSAADGVVASGACCEGTTGRAPAGKSARNSMSTDTPVAMAIRRRRVAPGPPSNNSHSIADCPPLARNATSRRSAWWMIVTG